MTESFLLIYQLIELMQQAVVLIEQVIGLFLETHVAVKLFLLYRA
jgi:hypothetical protein